MPRYVSQKRAISFLFIVGPVWALGGALLVAAEIERALFGNGFINAQKALGGAAMFAFGGWMILFGLRLRRREARAHRLRDH